MRTDVFSADILADVDASSVIPRLPHSSLKNGGVKWNICLFSCRFLTVDNTNPDILFASSFILIQMTATVTLLILFVPKVSAEKHCRPLTFVTWGGHVGQRFRNLSLDLTCMVTSSSRAKEKFSVPRNSIWPPCDKSSTNELWVLPLLNYPARKRSIGSVLNCQQNVRNIVVITKSTCDFTLHRVWNIDVHNAENSIPGL